MITPLEQLEQNIFDRIDNDLSMATVVVLQEKKGITDNDLLQTLASNTIAGTKKGACIIIGEAFYDINHPGTVGPMIEPQVYIRCIVRPMVNDGPNGTGISVNQLELSVLQLLHNYIMGDINVTLTAQKGDPIQWVGGERERSITVKGSIKLKPPAKCATVLITEIATDNVTLVCATGGASIYYTTDGSYPSPTNETATLYAGPISTLTAGAGLRAVAFNQPNYVASDLAYCQIN